MQITATNPYASIAAKESLPSAAEVTRTDTAFKALFADATPEEMLHDITKEGVEGMMKWKVRELEKQIAEKALAARGISVADVAALPPKERIALEQQIMREVAEKLKEAMNEQMKRERRVGELDIYDPSALQPSIDISA